MGEKAVVTVALVLHEGVPAQSIASEMIDVDGGGDDDGHDYAGDQSADGSVAHGLVPYEVNATMEGASADREGSILSSLIGGY